MKITPSLPDDFYDQGFTNATDPFGLKEFAVGLTKLFGDLEHGTVSILDGRWGSGKTVFAKQWERQLRQSGIPAIYLDAFASDYLEDPFQAISATIIKAAQDARQESSGAYGRFVEAASKAAKRIGSTAAKIGTKVITLGVIGAAEIDQISAIKDDLASALADATDDAVKKHLEDQAGAEATFLELKKSLSELPELLSSGLEGQASSRNLVIIIDELDRCRPDFALGILEVLKHFFRADCLQFVLVTNLAHLSLAVSNRYGIGQTADEYLQKFYDFIIHFEEHQHNGPRSKAYLGALISSLLAQGPIPNIGYELQDHLKAITGAYDLSLRQVERLLTNITLSYQFVEERQFRPIVLVAHLCALKALAPSKYQKAKMGLLHFDELKEFIKVGAWEEHYDIDQVLRVFRFHMDPDIDPNSDEFRGFGNGLYQYNFRSSHDVIPYLCSAVIDRFGR